MTSSNGIGGGSGFTFTSYGNVDADEPVFQISVVARMVGIHQQTIRAYERVGLLRPARSAGNTRLFSHADVERLRTVVRLANDLGINLAGIEVILRLSQQIEELQRALAEARQERDEARAMLEGRRPSAAEAGQEAGDRR